MNTLRQNAETLTINDPAMATPLLEILIQAARPGYAETDDYDETLSFLFTKVPQFRTARNEHIESLSAAA